MKDRIYLLVLLCLSSVFSSTAQSAVTALPFELYGDHIFVKLKVNNSRDLDFIFDTGDGLTVLNIETARELNMERGSEAHTTSAEGTISGKLLKHQRIEINNIELSDLKIYETSLTHLEQSIGRTIDGIIGYDLLKSYVVSMNFDKMSLELYTSGSFTYSGSGKAYPINLTSYIPHIPAEVMLSNGEKIKGEFFINTGAKTTVDFNTHLVDSKGLRDKIGDSYIYLVSGLGDVEYEHHRGRVDGFSIGGFAFENVPAGLSHAPAGIQNHKKMAGIIGSGLLRKFNVTFDYKGKKMYWESNANFEKAFPVNASGIELQLDKGKTKVMVHKVFEGGAGISAGVRLNDELVKVNGKSASEMGLAELRRLFSQDGKTVTLTLSDGSDTRTAEVVLKSMI